MDQPNLQSLIEQAYNLKPAEQNELIKAIIFHRNERPLTEKEKLFVQESEKHFTELSKISTTLDKVFQKYE